MTTSTYACRCDNIGRSFQEIKEHLTGVHKIDVKTTPFHQTALTFLDGAGWSQQEYELTNKDKSITVHKTVVIERKKK